MLYVCVRGVMDVVFYVCIVTRGAVSSCVWEYECFVMQIMFVFCVNPVEVLNAVFCMACSFLKLVVGDHMEEAYS